MRVWRRSNRRYVGGGGRDDGGPGVSQTYEEDRSFGAAGKGRGSAEQGLVRERGIDSSTVRSKNWAAVIHDVRVVKIEIESAAISTKGSVGRLGCSQSQV